MAILGRRRWLYWVMGGDYWRSEGGCTGEREVAALGR